MFFLVLFLSKAIMDGWLDVWMDSFKLNRRAEFTPTWADGLVLWLICFLVQEHELLSSAWKTFSFFFFFTNWWKAKSMLLKWNWILVFIALAATWVLRFSPSLLCEVSEFLISSKWPLDNIVKKQPKLSLKVLDSAKPT